METYGIVVTCKGRLEHLRQSLPLLLGLPLQPLVSVVDYGCPDRTFDWCVGQHHPRLQAILVRSSTYPFNRSRAKNIGAVRTPRSVLCFVDADCIVTTEWLECIAGLFARRADFGLVSPMTDDASGTCAIRSGLFHCLRGYDEQLADWGYEDSDLYARAYDYGGTAGFWDRSLVRVLGHDNAVRYRYHEVKDPELTWNRNKEFSSSPARGRINPTGYGLADCVIRRR